MATRTAVPAPPIHAAPRPVPAPRPHVDGWLLAGILAFGALLRARGLATFPLEQDELYTVIESRDLFRVALEPGIDARPLYFLLQHAVTPLLPATAVGLRAMPFLFGMLGIWATWAAGRRLFGTAAGAAGALLLAISPWHMHASGMARYNSLLYLLAALYFLALVRAYETDRPRDYVTALAALVLGTLVHPTFLFPAAGAALGATLAAPGARVGWRWPSRRAWIHLWGPFLVLLAAGYAALRAFGRTSAIQNWSGRGWLASLRLIPAVVEWATPALVAAGVAGIGLLLFSGRNAQERRWGWVALAGCATTAALLLAASFRTDVYADYAMPMLPLLFVSAGAMVGAAWGARPVAGGAALVVLAAATLPSTLSHLSDGTRFDYAPAFRHVRATAPRVPVVTWPLVVQRRIAPDLRGYPLQMSTRYLDSMRVAHGDLWVVASVRRYGISMDDDGRVEAWLNLHCTREAAYERPRWDYRMYRVELHRCGRGAARPL